MIKIYNEYKENKGKLTLDRLKLYFLPKWLEYKIINKDQYELFIKSIKNFQLKNKEGNIGIYLKYISFWQEIDVIMLNVYRKHKGLILIEEHRRLRNYCIDHRN